MSPKGSHKPGPNDVPLFDVEQTAQYGYHPEEGDTPYLATEFTVHEPTAATPEPEPQPNHVPRDGYAEPGISMDVAERARILHDFIPFIAGIAMRTKMPKAMHTEAAADIEGRYGEETGRRVNTASRNAEDMRQNAWKTLHRRLGYEAVGKRYPESAPVMRRETSTDLQRMFDKYGAGKKKDREAFQKQLDAYAPRPKKPRKR